MLCHPPPPRPPGRQQPAACSAAQRGVAAGGCGAGRDGDGIDPRPICSRRRRRLRHDPPIDRGVLPRRRHDVGRGRRRGGAGGAPACAHDSGRSGRDGGGAPAIGCCCCRARCGTGGGGSPGGGTKRFGGRCRLHRSGAAPQRRRRRHACGARSMATGGVPTQRRLLRSAGRAANTGRLPRDAARLQVGVAVASNDVCDAAAAGLGCRLGGASGTVVCESGGGGDGSSGGDGGGGDTTIGRRCRRQHGRIGRRRGARSGMGHFGLPLPPPRRGDDPH